MLLIASYTVCIVQNCECCLALKVWAHSKQVCWAIGPVQLSFNTCNSVIVCLPLLLAKMAAQCHSDGTRYI